MDEMRIKLSTKFMRNIASKLIAKLIYKKLGYQIDINIEDLDVVVVDGETKVKTNVELKLSNDEFMKIMKTIG